MKDEEIRETANMIRAAIPKKNRYEQPIWQGVLNLIEQSDFGKKDSEAEIESPLPSHRRNSLDEMMDGGFDGVQMQMLEICISVLSAHGAVSMIPYSKGLGTRSMTLVFKAGKTGCGTVVLA